MNKTDKKLRRFISDICAKRNVADYFDRFEQGDTLSGDLRLHLDIIETGRGRPTIVFMPGTNAYALLYGEFLSALADEGYNIVGFDPRGHGRSQGARGSYTMPELVADMRAVVKYARQRFDGPIVISGSSQGGIAAFYLAAEGYPVAGALCHNVADLGDPKSVALTRDPELSRLLKPFIAPASRLFPEIKIPMTFYINLKQEPIRNLGNSADLLRMGPLLVPYIRLKGMASLGSERLPCPVEDIATPIMILHGEKDVIFPQSYIEYIYNKLTCDKELKIYKGFHHYIVFDHVDVIVPDVVKWLQRICG